MKQGFSLVELIVVVGIVIVLTGIGAASINSFTQTKKLESATNELSTQIKLARSMALTSQIPSGASGGISFVKVVVGSDFNIQARAIRVVGVGVTLDVGQYFSKTLDAISGLLIKDPLTPVDFGFSAASGRLVNAVTGDFIDGPVTIILGINGDDDTLPIVINGLGLIDD